MAQDIIQPRLFMTEELGLPVHLWTSASASPATGLQDLREEQAELWLRP